MSNVGSVPPKSQAHPSGLTALEPYVRRIRAEIMRAAGRGRSGGSLRLRIGTRSLQLDAWILESLMDSSVAPDDGTPAGLLFQAVAFSAKCLHDTETLAGIDRRDVHRMHALEAEVMLDVALGTALLREIQSRVDSMVQDGKIDLAKTWNQMRQSIQEILASAKESLRETEVQEADRLSWEFSGAVSADTNVTKASPAVPPIPLARRVPGASKGQLPLGARGAAKPRPAQHPPDEAEEGAEARSSGASLAIAIVIAVVGVGMLVFRGGTPSVPAAGLTLQQLPGAVRIERFEPRAISSSVIVQDEVWNELDERTKLGWMNDLGRSLARRGNKGLVLRSNSGRVLAHWLAARGAALVDSRDLSGAATQAKDVARTKLY